MVLARTPVLMVLRALLLRAALLHAHPLPQLGRAVQGSFVLKINNCTRKCDEKHSADASGHYNSGAYSGSRHWLGSKQQCLKLDKNQSSKDDKEILEKYKSDAFLNAVLRKEFTHGNIGIIVEMKRALSLIPGQEWRTMSAQDPLVHRALASVSSPPLRLAFTTVRLTLNITKLSMAKSQEIVQGVCLPRSCTPEDISAIMNFSIMITDTLKTNRTVPRTVKVISSRRIEETYDISRDIQALVIISITVFLLLLSLLATLVENNMIKCKPRSKTKSFNVQKYNNDLNSNSNVVDMERLAVNNVSNINLASVQKMKTSGPPCITLDVMTLENKTNSCKRCGKYKKQCVNPKMNENLDACPRIKYNSYPSLVGKRHFCEHLLLCFSLNYSWKRLFNTNMANKDLSVMHGLRIITTFWVVFLHVATVTSYLSDNDTNMGRQNNVYMILATGSIAFDTLLFVSGLFSAYHFFYLKSQYSVEELVSFGGPCGQLLQLVCFITNRAVRLLPSYVYTVFLAAFLSRVSRHTAALELPGRDHDCGATWWRNILYITNAYPQEERHGTKDAGSISPLDRKTDALSEETASSAVSCAKSLVWELGRRLRDRGCDPRSGSYLVHQVALAIQRGNVAGIMGTFEPAETQLHAAGALLCAIARHRLALALAALAGLAGGAADVAAALGERGRVVRGDMWIPPKKLPHNSVFRASTSYQRPRVVDATPALRKPGVRQQRRVDARKMLLLPDAFAAYRLIMERPFARIAPYFIGIFGGWLVRRMGGKLMVSRSASTCLWLASLSVLAIASAVPWVSPLWTSSLLHLAWPAVLLWPALVCATDYAGFCRRLLDSSAVAALSRLCYSILLLHGVVTRTVLLSMDGALCSSTMCIWSYFAGTTLLTLLASLLLSLLVEMPCCSLLRRLSDCASS
ncbi:hypothetical protein MSG28_000035 [Choristoneura fumiferana]|uniref:Uncharacterized protein n=1 Tax=Choristoneura fumiferana TaxID=7141 RepID=A0ACC0JZH4_CHOFU|nr:hypothetical protein MSG28_000035 [Choristoneura fumiferana]